MADNGLLLANLESCLMIVVHVVYSMVTVIRVDSCLMVSSGLVICIAYNIIYS